MPQHYTPPKSELVAFHCPHCGVFAQQRWFPLFMQTNAAIVDFRTAKCTSCEKNSIWYQNEMVYPNSGTAPLPNVDMPDDVKQDYDEAREITQKSPRGAAALLRLAIQKLVVHLGEKGKDLNVDIANLVKKGLPQTLQMALDSVRVVGNNAVHPGQIELTDNIEVVNKLFVFVNVICENQISIPKTIGEYYQTILPEGAKDAIKKRDNQT